MNFAESVKYLYGLGNEVLAMKLGLANIRAVLVALGDPQLNYPKVQIAGTNGKGSTVAFLEAMCIAAGLKTGATTSPHLISVTERVRIAGEKISEPDFARFATRVRDVSEDLVRRGTLETVPTYFEQVTAIALLTFAERGVEIAILETGLGGRFDATTAADAEIVAITRIAFDHQRILGNSITAIASEKAAIIGHGKVAAIGEQPPEALRLILDRCAECAVVPRLASKVSAEKGPEGLSFRTETGEYIAPTLGLAGNHQIENAKTAILLAEALSLSPEAIETGLLNARHRGRLERIGRFLLDGAHNEDGAAALRRYLTDHVSTPVVMIFGAMRDKELDRIAELLFPFASTVIVTRADNQRSMDVADLAAIARRHATDVRGTPTVADAIALAGSIVAPDQTIVVTGSLYLVGEALGHMDNG